VKSPVEDRWTGAERLGGKRQMPVNEFKSIEKSQNLEMKRERDENVATRGEASRGEFKKGYLGGFGGMGTALIRGIKIAPR